MPEAQSRPEAIRTAALTRRFGRLLAVQDLDLRVERGEIYGFLGPNGAGKTTTVLLLLGLLPPTAGSAWLLGQPVRADDTALRRRIGVMSEHPYLYGHMTAWEYLRFFADLYAVPRWAERAEQVLSAVELLDRRHSPLREFSRGMQQKVGLARALLHDPELLLLDEPTAGLDPYGIKQVREILLAERGRGKTILISSHILSEVERTADRVGILVKGRLQAQDTVARLVEQVRGETVVQIDLHRSVPGLAERVQALPFAGKVEANGTSLTVWLPANSGTERQAELSTAIASAGGAIVQMATRRASLEEAFLTITEADALGWVGRAHVDG